MPTPVECEKWAAACFERMNMVVHRAVRTGTKRGKIWVSQANDIFGIFDIIVIDPVTGFHYMFQVTSSYKQASKKRKEVAAWIDEQSFTSAAFLTNTMGILVYSSQQSRTDKRTIDRFFYREEYQWEWKKCEPLVIPRAVV